MSKISNFLNNIITLIMPQRCPFCYDVIENNEIICKKCKKDIPAYAVCQGVKGGYRCTSAFLYIGKFKRAVLNFKFGRRIQYSKQFAFFLYKSVNQSFPDIIFDFVTFVPMHEAAQNKRGFNQSELLARDLAELLSLPCVPTLIKTKRTPPQHNLKAKSRSTNLKGKFKVIDKKAIKGKSILIVDDIVTTGSTLGECAKTLQKCNPMHICCATVLANGKHLSLEK